jgi:hypothetical protein
MALIDRQSTIFLTLCAMTLMSGCGSSTTGATKTADPNQATQVLKDVLDDWKKGEPHDAPMRRSPSISVADEDWLQGAKLVDYKLESGDKILGRSLSCPVTLSLRLKSGKDTSKKVFYLVNTDPSLSVIRQD